jgi:hypothetical protein
MLAYGLHPHVRSTYSAADTGRGTSNRGAGNWGGVGKSQGESISSSVLGVISGDGDGNGMERSSRKLNGALWGRGEMSMESGTKQGDEEGIGGVVTPSHRTDGVVAPSAAAHVSTQTYKADQWHSHLLRVSVCRNRFDVKSDRRGVAS